MRCLGSSSSVAVLGTLVRRDCDDDRMTGVVSEGTEVPRGKAGNLSEREPDPDVPASKTQMSDGIVAEMSRNNDVAQPRVRGWMDGFYYARREVPIGPRRYLVDNLVRLVRITPSPTDKVETALVSQPHRC